MASSSNTTTTTCFTLPSFAQFLALKLDEHNYLLWLSQVVPTLKSHELMGIVDGSDPCPPQTIPDAEGKDVSNPAYAIWVKKDQFLLSWINVNLAEYVLATVYGLHTSRQVWNSLKSRFASQSRSRISHLKRQLQNLNQGSKSCSEYLSTAKRWADQLAAIGKPTDDEDLISFIISGLNPTFNSFVTSISIAARDNPLSFLDFQDELLNHEMLLNQQQQNATTDVQNFALFMQRQGGGPSRPNFHSFNKKGKAPQFNRFPPKYGTSKGISTPGTSGPASRQFSSSNNNGGSSNQPSRAPCQICGKTSHQALDCFHRMDYTYQGHHPPPQLAAMVAQTNSTCEEQSWFADSGANAHITSELENLTIQPQPFQGPELVAVGNGAGLNIEHTGSTIIHSSNIPFHLKNILHCPTATTNLLSIQKFCQDNNCYFILTSSHFFVKDLRTHALLLEGKSENGLYPLRLRRCSSKNAPVFTAFLGIKASTLVWHSRLGHPSLLTVNRVIKAHSLPILNNDSNKEHFCDSCQLGKSKKLPFSASNRITTSVLELIHTDLWTSPIPSISGCKYYIIFVDDFTRYTWFYPLHFKSDTYNCFVKFKVLVETQFSCKIRQLQSDGGGEYTSHLFQNFLTSNGIQHRKSCPHTSQQNGLAERKLRHILETGLTLLAHSGLSNRYWVDAFMTSVFIINRLPTPILNNTSPYEKLFLKSPDYTLLRIFGCKCFPLLRPYTAHKLEFRSKVCIFLGYSHAGYRCLDPVTDRVYLSRHVVFDEQSFPAKDHARLQVPSKISAVSDAPFMVPVSIPDPISPSLSPNTTPHTATTSSSLPSNVSSLDASLDHPSSSPSISLESPCTILDQLPITSPAPAPAPSESDYQPIVPPAPAPSESLAPNVHPMTTHSRTGSLKPKTFDDFHLYYTTKYSPLQAFPSILTETEPTCFTKAAIDSRWRAAMTAEFEALISNGTWTLCPRPLHQRVIRNRWVYKIKQRADGSIDRFKARLVAKGFEQESGVDYTETFSPVIKPSTIRIILALAVHFDWPIKQLDVSNAFLHGTLLEEVYMEQPQGFVDGDKPDFVCKLHKSIYGLKQAPRAWFTCLSTALLELGFTASLVDSSLFLFFHGDITIFMLVYVDDIIVTGNQPSVIQSLIIKLQQRFPLKDLGQLGFFLGIKATHSTTCLHLSQSKYIADILRRTRMFGAKPTTSPCSSGSKLSKHDGELLADPSEYRQVVGALQYCTLTRPDISYVVNQLCQQMHSPSSSHWSAAKRVLRYLKHTPDHGLLYTKGQLHLQAFCDSDWAGCPDDRRSTSGYGIFLGNYLVSWSAKKQAVVSRSSTEAEYRSMALTTAELFWLRMLFQELRISLAVAPVLWCDNVSALALASNPVFHARTKHIEVDYHFIREKVLNRDILIKFISTGDQLADVFTKGLSSARFALLRSKLMVLPRPLSLRGNVKVAAATSSHEDSAAAHDMLILWKSALIQILLQNNGH
jgi:hypothetical protein